MGSAIPEVFMVECAGGIIGIPQPGHLYTREPNMVSPVTYEKLCIMISVSDVLA